MTFELKGNFFNNKFVQAPQTGPDSVEKWIERECPADTDQILWKLPIHYGHVDEILESSAKGFKSWRKSWSKSCSKSWSAPDSRLLRKKAACINRTRKSSRGPRSIHEIRHSK